MEERLEYRRVYDVIFFDGKIKAHRVGEDYEVRGKTIIVKRSSRINLMPADLRYIEEKELLKVL